MQTQLSELQVGHWCVPGAGRAQAMADVQLNLHTHQLLALTPKVLPAPCFPISEIPGERTSLASCGTATVGMSSPPDGWDAALGKGK